MDRGGLTFFHSVIWDKRKGLGMRYLRHHEMLMVAHRRGGRIRWGDGIPPQPNIISMAAPQARSHPNEKPLALMQRIVATHSKLGDTILDPFLGGGTTGVAAVTLGRKFIGIELDPQHFETACRRISAALAQRRLDLLPPPPPSNQDALPI